jgi:hypothetical protein
MQPVAPFLRGHLRGRFVCAAAHDAKFGQMVPSAGWWDAFVRSVRSLARNVILSFGIIRSRMLRQLFR